MSATPFLIRLLLVQVLPLGATLWLASRLGWGARGVVAWTLGVYGVAVVWMVLMAAVVTRVRAPLYRWMSWIGTVALGLWSSWIVCAAVAELLGWGLRAWLGERAPGAQVWAQGAWALALASTAVGLSWVWRGPIRKHVQVRLGRRSGMPSAAPAARLRIAQVSDLHVSATIGPDWVERVVAHLATIDADILLLTGDLVDGEPDDLEADLARLNRVRPRLGVWVVLGNHEHYWNGATWRAAYARLGWRVLDDAHAVVTAGTARWCLVGIDDPQGRFGQELRRGSSDPAGSATAAPHSSALERALAGAPSAAEAPRILLSHRPENFRGQLEEAARSGISLQLSGHTHAGQYFPFSLLVGWFHRLARGLTEWSPGYWVYVHPGTGYWGPPNRLGVPPEVTEIEVTYG